MQNGTFVCLAEQMISKRAGKAKRTSRIFHKFHKFKNDTNPALLAKKPFARQDEQF